MAKEHFIPFRKSDIVAMCLRDSDFDQQQQEDFAHCCRLLHSIFHFEFHQRLEQLKDRYALVNPDAQAVNRRLEHWFKAQWRCQLDFDSTDALEKLGRLGQPGAQDGTWQVRAAAEAGIILGDRWNAFFKGGKFLL